MKKKVIGAFTLTVFSSGIFFLFNFILAKYLGADAYGKIVYLVSFINIVALLITMNYVSLYMRNAIVEKDQNTFSLFFTVHTFLFVLLAIPVYYILLHFIEKREEVLLVLSIAYLSTLVKTIGLEYNTRKEIVRSIILSILTPRSLLIIIFIVMILWGMESSFGYLYAYLLSNLLVILYSYSKMKPGWYMKREFFRKALKFYFLGILGSSFVYIIQILQKHYGNYELLANLSVALLIFSGLSLFGTVLVKFVLPKIHELYREKNINRIGILYQNNTFLELLIVFPVFMVLFFEIDTLSFFLGSDYDSLTYYFYILSLGYGIGFFTGISGNLLRATEHEVLEIYNEIVRMIIGLGLIALFHNYSLGMVIALSIAMFIYNLVKCIELFILYRFTPLSSEHLKKTFLYIGLLVFIGSGISMIDMVWLKIVIYLLFLLVTYGVIFIYLKKNYRLLEGYA